MASPPNDERSGTDPSVTPIMEDYLKAIYTLHTESGMRVSTSEVATRLDVQPPTVTSMFETLQERGLIEREKHRPVVLTEDGEVVALRVLRNIDLSSRCSSNSSATAGMRFTTKPTGSNTISASD